MKKFIVFFISFILIFNPSVLYAKTIYQKTKFSKVKCNIENLSFMDYFYCLDDRIFRDIDATKSTKKTYDLKYITYTAQVIADTVEEGLISDNQAKFFWNDFINSDYKKRLKKKKLQKILDNSKCLENKDYKIFINCFYKEFRNLEVYKAADIINKYRIENIVFHALYLTKPEGKVAVINTYDLSHETFDKYEGFDFFFNMMNKLGTKYFLKIKSYDEEQIRKVITFIVIALILAYVAKRTIFKKGSSSVSTSTSGSTTTSSSSLNSISSVCAQGHGALCRGAGQGIQHTKWFRYAYSRGFFF